MRTPPLLSLPFLFSPEPALAQVEGAFQLGGTSTDLEGSLTTFGLGVGFSGWL